MHFILYCIYILLGKKKKTVHREVGRVPLFLGLPSVSVVGYLIVDKSWIHYLVMLCIPGFWPERRNLSFLYFMNKESAYQELSVNIAKLLGAFVASMRLKRK